MLEVLGENFADINARGPKGVTAAILAAEYGYADVLDWLQGNGADMYARDDCGRTPLW